MHLSEARSAERQGGWRRAVWVWRDTHDRCLKKEETGSFATGTLGVAALKRGMGKKENSVQESAFQGVCLDYLRSYTSLALMALYLLLYSDSISAMHIFEY
jgi:hypothetical protein